MHAIFWINLPIGALALLLAALCAGIACAAIAPKSRQRGKNSAKLNNRNMLGFKFFAS
jgi:hypothetical protein